MIQYGFTKHEVMDSFRDVEVGIKEVKVENGEDWEDFSDDDLAMENVTHSGCLYGRIDVDKGKEIAYKDADQKKDDGKTVERAEVNNAIEENSLVKQLKRTLISVSL
ncbi:hypothetical protein GH714_002346 [Hevea brasiliensis]|uniref:Uncharacterized protein n=1 Tax=Hevea brasiliensis TaxID=3981 RepID=A0A6A6KPX5_HEVBR|nr:hypothetical protein GH714_002346 [Hevea brasiliensis]